MNANQWFKALMTCLALLAAGCGDDTQVSSNIDTQCSNGEVGCVCTEDTECNDGLDCFNGLCVPGQDTPDPCEEDPCLNGGTCQADGDSFTCECVNGFEGEVCDQDIDECADEPCQNGGTCINGVNSFTCECAEGFEGDTCEGNIDDCAGDNPCANGGTCVDGIAEFTCECAEGFEGETCEDDVDDCADNPCANGGTCIDQTGGFTCECAEGFEGETCEGNIDDCADNPCANGGTCVDGIAEFTCECAEGFEGETCEGDVDDCAGDNPCANDGTCIDGVGGFTCDCAEGFEGDTCETNIDDCGPGACFNGGTCIDGVNSFTCECAEGFEGETCQTNTDDCADDPCQNGATCIDGIAEFTCECAEGFEGDNCDVNIDECAGDNPCANGGTCVDEIGTFSCDCPAGFEGDTCETNIDDCADEPCLNGGTCTDGIAEFTCECAEGFEGETCETNIDDCAGDNPCANGGTCVDGIAEFTCECAEGFEGETCEDCVDGDEDGICDVDDGCPEDFDDGTDSDEDGLPDACDCNPGIPLGDEVCDTIDNDCNGELNDGLEGFCFVVNTFEDTSDQSSTDEACLDAQGNCSLRAALEELGTENGDNTVILPAGTYQPTLGEAWEVIGDVTLRAVTEEATILDFAQGAGLQVGETSEFTVEGLTLQNATDSAIDCADCDAITLTGAHILNNATEGNGGAMEILSDDTDFILTITNSVIENNTAVNGAGVYLITGDDHLGVRVTITDSTFINNDGNRGGHFYFDARTATLLRDFTVTSSRFEDANVETASAFYMLLADGHNLSFTDTVFDNNRSGSNGGAVVLGGNSGTSDVLVNRCLFTGNRADSGGAFSISARDMGWNFEFLNSAVTRGLVASGGFTVAGSQPSNFLFQNSTFTGNAGTNNVSLNFSGTSGTHLILDHVTIAGNGFARNYGALNATALASFTVGYSILTSNDDRDGVNELTDNYNIVNVGTMTSLGYNLLAHPVEGLTTLDTDIVGTNEVFTIADLGSTVTTDTTVYRPPNTTSPAFDAIPAEDLLLDTDQRGVARPQNGRGDIGAIEAEVNQ